MLKGSCEQNEVVSEKLNPAEIGQTKASIMLVPAVPSAHEYKHSRSTCPVRVRPSFCSTRADNYSVRNRYVTTRTWTRTTTHANGYEGSPPSIGTNEHL